MFNHVVLQGNLVRDVEFADVKGDCEIVNFTVASSRKYKNKEDVTFMDCTAFGQTAENIGKFFSKGSPIGVEGRLSQNNWEDRDGNKRSKIFITVESFHFTGSTDSGNSRDNSRGRGSSRGRSSGSRSRGNSYGGSRDRNNGRGSGSQGQRGYGQSREDYQDDIPFCS